MSQFEYKVIPAPERGKKAKSARSAPDRFAHALETVMNEMATEGWEYHRAETLPSEERAGLTGKITVYRNLLIFRRALPGSDAAMPRPAAASVPAPEAPRRTEADRARTAGHRPEAGGTIPAAPAESMKAPQSAADAAAAAAAALRSVSAPRADTAQAVRAPTPPVTKDAGDGAPGLVQLMGTRRKT